MTTSFMRFQPGDTTSRGGNVIADAREVIIVDGDGVRHEAPVAFTEILDKVLRASAGGQTVTINTVGDMMTAQEAADFLGVSRPTVYAWQDRNILGRDDHGKKRMVPTADVHRYQGERAERAAWRSAHVGFEGTDASADAAARVVAGSVDLGKAVAGSTVRPRRRTRVTEE